MSDPARAKRVEANAFDDVDHDADADQVSQLRAVLAAIAGASGETERLMAQANRLVAELTRSSAGIQSIAREIQLLAVNAGVEPARHGAAGRGRAVIAEAVMKLADKTRASTVATKHSLARLSETMAALCKHDGARIAIIANASAGFAVASGANDFVRSGVGWGG